MKNELLDLVGKFENSAIAVCGDVILDHYIWGSVSRISPEAPVVVVDTTEEDRRLGGAANVVSNLRELGASVSIFGVLGDDERAQIVNTLLDEQGVSRDGLIIDSNRKTTVKTRVIAGHQQVVRVDRESKELLSPKIAGELAEKFLSASVNSNAVIISDYAKGVVTSQLVNGIDDEYAKGLFGLKKIPVIIDPKDRNFGLYSKASVIKPNRREAQIASGVEITDRASAKEAANVLLNKWKTEEVLITLGDLGMILLDREGNFEEIDTVAQEVFDVSGAGDTVSAVFTLALSVGASPYNAAFLANIAAGVVLREVGAVPITKKQLLDEINRLT